MLLRLERGESRAAVGRKRARFANRYLFSRADYLTKKCTDRLLKGRRSFRTSIRSAKARVPVAEEAPEGYLTKYQAVRWPPEMIARHRALAAMPALHDTARLSARGLDFDAVSAELRA